MDNKIIPFSFQKGQKETGCEDAPPIATVGYSVVCDGLGGSGATKHMVSEGSADAQAFRTSAYLGSRIVCDCIDAYYAANVNNLISAINGQRKVDIMNTFLCKLKEKINLAFAENMRKWNIEPSSGKTMKTFPTTLASAIYYPHPKGMNVLVIWAGDSRVYALTPKKGLQLLSMDDAVNAENEMNSSSEMTNCISAGRPFQLNYAFYELNEPCIVFCCSDGCFDYLLSPLHFEWLLLHTILECMPDSKNEKLGVALAESIRDNVYVKIGDDTTMSGVIIGMDSVRRMKSLYQARYRAFDKVATRMNQYLTERKKAKDDRYNLDKTCRLFEGNDLSLIRDEVCRALNPTSSNILLRTRLTSMTCYAEYTQQMHDIETTIEDECATEIQKTQEVANHTKKICQSMLVCDYLKWQRQTEEPNVSFSVFGVTTQRRKKPTYMHPSTAIRSLLTCIELFNHPCFKSIVSLPALPEDELDNYIRSQVNQLEALLAILDNNDWRFEDMWTQAYFSIDYFSEERDKLIRNPQIKTLIEQAMLSPQNCQFASELTVKKIEEYRNQLIRINEIRDNLSAEKTRRSVGISDEYWNKHKHEILEMIISENDMTLREMFRDTPISIERLESYVQAKRDAALVDQRITAAQMEIDKIWNNYKIDYQLFQQIIEKGAY